MLLNDEEDLREDGNISIYNSPDKFKIVSKQFTSMLNKFSEDNQAKFVHLVDLEMKDIAFLTGAIFPNILQINLSSFPLQERVC